MPTDQDWRDHREALVNALTPETTHPSGLDDELEGAALIGFVLVAEWVTPDGDRILTSFDSGPTGERVPDWTRKGWLHEALEDVEWCDMDVEFDDDQPA